MDENTDQAGLPHPPAIRLILPAPDHEEYRTVSDLTPVSFFSETMKFPCLQSAYRLYSSSNAGMNHLK
jgi:hypothetical protein